MKFNPCPAHQNYVRYVHSRGLDYRATKQTYHAQSLRTYLKSIAPSAQISYSRKYHLPWEFWLDDEQFLIQLSDDFLVYVERGSSEGHENKCISLVDFQRDAQIFIAEFRPSINEEELEPTWFLRPRKVCISPP